MAAMAESSLFHEQPFAAVKQAQSPSSCRSRSTSAGSSPVLSSAEQLPSIEYPTPQLEAIKQRMGMPEINYPSPLVVRNTFLDYADRSPMSLLDGRLERQIQSCPVSSLMAPPGLEHLGSQLSDASDADFMPVRPDFFMASPEKNAGLPDFEYPSPFVVRNTFLEEAHQLGSLADFMIERQAKSCPASGIGLPPGLSSASSGFGSSITDASSSPPPAYEPVMARSQTGAVPPPPPMAPPSFPPAAQIPALPAFVPPPPPAPAQAPKLRIAEALAQTLLGSPQMPTVGSASHQLGSCKPCAFLFTRGCESGVNCTFCHLCPPGEKKRRQKAKHAAAKMNAKLTASGVEPSLAITTAASWAAMHATAHVAPPMYR
eukprot:gb/GFBE01038806.1/.p1 GENE.gb/GFBE01038806.1/~~gb/GFBE01038806.1/.p1  ORF type:complete len:373 (+),score=77.71 gb/GFBE01038806.1/:1-1119(+)